MITFLAPLRSEAIAVRWGLRGRADVRVVRTGSGVRQSVPNPAAIFGVCGGLDPTLRPGDLIVADRLTRPDGRPLDVDLTAVSDVARALRSAAGWPTDVRGALQDDKRTSATGPPMIREGSIAGADRVVRGAAARRALLDRGALGVDLESWALASRVTGPVIVVRAVVDTPDAELLSPATFIGGIRALRALCWAAPLVARTLNTRRSSPWEFPSAKAFRSVPTSSARSWPAKRSTPSSSSWSLSSPAT